MSWGSVLVGLQKHINFIRFELRISSATWEEAELWACWFFRDPDSQQLLTSTQVHSLLFFLENYESVPWVCLISFQVWAVCPVTSNREWGGGTRGGTEPRMRLLGPEPFQIQSPDYFHVTWTSHCFPWFFLRSLIIHIMKGFVYRNRGNNWI